MSRKDDRQTGLSGTNWVVPGTHWVVTSGTHTLYTAEPLQTSTLTLHGLGFLCIVQLHPHVLLLPRVIRIGDANARMALAVQQEEAWFATPIDGWSREKASTTLNTGREVGCIRS